MCICDGGHNLAANMTSWRTWLGHYYVPSIVALTRKASAVIHNCDRVEDGQNERNITKVKSNKIVLSLVHDYVYHIIMSFQESNNN